MSSINNVNSAIDRIKSLECPTGEVESRVADILQEYNVANKSEVNIYRNESLDSVGAEAYTANFANNPNQHLVVLAKSGLDDYVATVVDAYIM
ncbi:hypothetical protein [Tissierella sp. Yu-01]|jgi:hypothetical protein|uniref:hypothetical protein n=1 Tax=Tissierella sp. Yu-01 TaxID=3035694 RepID=UPI00240D9B56|nr:hypothetical protein [Tissierella sp. Yu-01]WFA09049.1 hypothetical protein P3962_00335 [Tissierella sp. Yu-01]